MHSRGQVGESSGLVGEGDGKVGMGVMGDGGWVHGGGFGLTEQTQERTRINILRFSVFYHL